MQQEMEERIQGEKVQSLLYHISNAALETQDISELIHQIKEILGELIDTTNMYVALYQKNQTPSRYHLSAMNGMILTPSPWGVLSPPIP